MYMSKRKTMIALVLILALLVTLAGCSSATNTPAANNPSGSDSGLTEKVFLNFGSSGASSSLYLYCVSIAESVKKGTNGMIDITVVETGSAKDNLLRMHKGQTELGIVEESINLAAKDGEGEFAGDPIPETRILWIETIAPQPWMVTVDSGVTKLEDLQGKSFMYGMRGSSSEVCSEKVATLLGVTPDAYRGTLEDGVNAVKDRRLTGLVKSGVQTSPTTFGPDPSIIEVNNTVPMRLIGLNPEQAKLVEENLPGYPLTTIPKGTYTLAQDEDVVLPSMVMFVGVVSQVDEEVVYQLTKAAFENKKIQETAFPTVRYIDYFKDTMKYAKSPLHAGVIRYFKEQGYEVPDRLIPPEMK